MPSANKSKKRKPAGKKNKGKRKEKFDDDYQDKEERALAKKLKDRFSHNRSKKNEDVVTDACFDPSTRKFIHSTKYQMRIARSIDSHYNRITQPESPEVVLKTRWICVFCQNRSCEKDLGDLYGPYYISVKDDLNSHLPHFLFEDGQNQSVPDGCSIGVWFHGRCCLRTPQMQLVGGRLPELGRILQFYWAQKCVVCHKFGASVPLRNEQAYMHFPCANESELKI